MPSLKSTLARALRSNSIAPQSHLFNVAARGIIRTTRNGSRIELAPKSQRTPLLLPQEFTHPISPPTQYTPLPSPRLSDPSTSNPFTTLLTALTTSLTNTPAPNLPHLTSLLRAYASSPSHWSPYAHANARKQYTRNLVHQIPDLFNLLLLVWTPGKASPVHDHADAHCLMKVLKGSLIERRYEIPPTHGSKVTNGESGGGGPMRETMKREYTVDKVTYMADQLGLHEILNPSPTEYAVSLHLYTPPNAAIRGCHVYDLESGDARHVMQGVYDSVNGIPTTSAELK